jgi:hypothetical protein
MAADQRLSVPSTSSGNQFISGATPWAYTSSWQEITAGISADISIIGITFQVTSTPALDTTEQVIFDIATGGSGSESVKIQIPYSYRNDTQVGYYHTTMYTVSLPEPYYVPANTRISIKAADSVGARLYNGVKIRYKEIPSPSFSQTAYRFYEDGAESSSTAIDAQNTNITRSVNSDSNLQLRVRIQETAGGSGATTDDYQLQYSLNSGTYYDIGLSGDVNTYYFNASDSGPTDSSNAWTNDANAFDGNTGTAATCSTDGTVLSGAGTTAPTSGGAISRVRARIYSELSGGGGAGWGSYSTLSTPSGGWTWQKVNDLSAAVTFYDGTTFTQAETQCVIQSAGVTIGTPTKVGSSTAGGQTGSVYRMEIEVTTSPVMNYNSSSLTDSNATTNRLGSGTGSFVAGEISEDSLVDNHQITWGNFTEYLYSLTIVESGVNNNDTLDFRVLRNGSTMTYSVTPRITVSKTTANTTNFFQFF